MWLRTDGSMDSLSVPHSQRTVCQSQMHEDAPVKSIKTVNAYRGGCSINHIAGGALGGNPAESESQSTCIGAVDRTSFRFGEVTCTNIQAADKRAVVHLHVRVFCQAGRKEQLTGLTWINHPICSQFLVVGSTFPSPWTAGIRLILPKC